MATAGSDTLDTEPLQALLGPQLTAEQARMIYDQGPEAVVFALLTLARLDHRAARRGPVGLAALPAGHHAGAGRRRVQLPPPLQALPGRAGADVAPTPGALAGLVPGDPDAGPGQRRVACRRDRLAGRR